MLNRDNLVDAGLGELADPDDWEIATNSIEVRPTLGAAVSLRLNADDARLVRKAARIEGVTQSEFIRSAARKHAIESLSKSVKRQQVRAESSVVTLVVDDIRARIDGRSQPEEEPVNSQLETCERKIDWSDWPSARRQRPTRRPSPVHRKKIPA